MHRLTIVQNGYDLEVDGNLIPAQFSSNIEIKFIKDEAYSNYIVIPSIAYGGITNSLKYNDGIIQLPREAFKQDGFIYLAFLLKSSVTTEEVNTNCIKLYVRESVGGVEILPSDEKSWVGKVTDAVDQYIVAKYVTIMDEVLEANKELNLNTIELQKVVNEIVDTLNQKLENNEFIPQHKIENGMLYFTNPDGTWDNGYALVGQTTITLDDVVQNNLILSATRDTTKDFETFVELKDDQGRKLSVSVSPKNIFMKSGETEVNLDQIIKSCQFDCGEDDSSYFLGTFEEWIEYQKTLNLEEN